LFPALYAILDVSPTQTAESALSLAEMLAGAGVRLMQVRGKHISTRDYIRVARRAVDAMLQRGVQVFINDRADIAGLSGATGVHVGQEDIPVDAARAACPPPMQVGVSTHNLAQVRAALLTSADYIAIGPIFATASKDNPDPVVGLELLKQARALTSKPLVAIGGITVETASDVYAAGADSVAVISDIARATDPAKRAAQYLEIAKRAKAAGA